MGDRFEALTDAHRRFIGGQKIFFVATAGREGSVNLSPKGQASLIVRDPKRILWLNFTGSGNETAAHLLDTNRITLMWCAFEGPPLILRVYGRARAIHPDEPDWAECAARIPATVGARQYFDVAIERVTTSCGYGVPLHAYEGERSAMTRWAEKKGEAGIREYWREKNRVSLDGLPTRATDLTAGPGSTSASTSRAGEAE
ncbi:MAG: pyridoxamine 5'-phosphate oxidase family protein [bacterium]